MLRILHAVRFILTQSFSSTKIASVGCTPSLTAACRLRPFKLWLGTGQLLKIMRAGRHDVCMRALYNATAVPWRCRLIAKQKYSNRTLCHSCSLMDGIADCRNDVLATRCDATEWVRAFTAAKQQYDREYNCCEGADRCYKDDDR